MLKESTRLKDTKFVHYKIVLFFYLFELSCAISLTYMERKKNIGPIFKMPNEYQNFQGIIMKDMLNGKRNFKF